MPVLVPIQPNIATHGKTGSLSSLPGSHGHAGAFAALLSGSMQPGRLSEVQPVVWARVAGPPPGTAEDSSQLAQSEQNENDSGTTLEVPGAAAEPLSSTISRQTKQAI